MIEFRGDVSELQGFLARPLFRQMLAALSMPLELAAEGTDEQLQKMLATLEKWEDGTDRFGVSYRPIPEATKFELANGKPAEHVLSLAIGPANGQAKWSQLIPIP